VLEDSKSVFCATIRLIKKRVKKRDSTFEQALVFGRQRTFCETVTCILQCLRCSKEHFDFLLTRVPAPVQLEPEADDPRVDAERHQPHLAPKHGRLQPSQHRSHCVLVGSKYLKAKNKLNFRKRFIPLSIFWETAPFTCFPFLFVYTLQSSIPGLLYSTRNCSRYSCPFPFP
jgi:hypothetical protein